MCHFAHYNINIYIYIIVPLLTRSQRLMTRDLNDTRDRTNTSGGGRTEKMTGKRKKLRERFENRNVDVVPLHRQ